MPGGYLDKTLIFWNVDCYRAGAVFNLCPTGCWQPRTWPRGYNLTLKLIWCARMPGGAVVNYPPASAGDADSIPGSGRSPGVGNGKPLQFSCLENSMSRGALWATAHGVAENWAQLNNWAQRAQGFKKPLLLGFVDEKSLESFPQSPYKRNPAITAKRTFCKRDSPDLNFEPKKQVYGLFKS